MPARTSTSQDWRRFRRGCLLFVVVSSLVWVLLDTLYVELPYLRPGSEIVINAKQRWSLNQPLFGADAKLRVLALGNSKTLASFNPKLFDADLAADGVTSKVQSVNEAIPGERRYVTYLEQMLAAGARPTHVLIQFPPIPEDHIVTWREWLRHDKLIVDTLFPFRWMPRNFTLFVFSSWGHGGLSGFYRESEAVARQLVLDRGYYFLKGQSHFANDRLPDDYHLPTDTPTKIGTRPVDTTLAPFLQLAALANKFGFKVVLFPPVYRIGELAPPPRRTPVEEPLAGWPAFLTVGDDYWLMAPSFFSDPVHPNIEGANKYTARLAALLAPVLMADER